jgi:hypothetical protein
MPAIITDTNVNSIWTGHVAGSSDPTITKFKLYQAPADLIASYQLVAEIANGIVADENLGAGDGMRTAFQTVATTIIPASLVLHVGTIGGVQLILTTDYTVTSGGAITLTAGGVTKLGNADLHGTYSTPQTFGPLSYSRGLFVVAPTRPFFLKCTQVQNGKETELAAEASVKITPTVIQGWSLGDLMAQGMRPTLVVGYDPVSNMYYPLNVVPDVANGGFKLKVDNS